MPVSLGDPTTLVYETTSGAGVTATVKTPDGTIRPTVTVPEDPDPGNTGLYPYTFTPDTVGSWRVTLHTVTGPPAPSRTFTVAVTDPTAGPPPFATADDIETMWRALTVDEAARADVLCRLASVMIRARVPSVDQRITDGRIPPEVAVLVCAQMVIRTLRNPGGIASETNGPWSVTYGTGAQTNTGLYLSLDDLALLIGADSAAMGRVATVTLAPPRAQVWPHVWPPVWHPA